jgi:hypothetical protein
MVNIVCTYKQFFLVKTTICRIINTGDITKKLLSFGFVSSRQNPYKNKLGHLHGCVQLSFANFPQPSAFIHPGERSFHDPSLGSCGKIL